MSARRSIRDRLRVYTLVVLAVAVFPAAAQSQTNSWSNSSGGYWDDFRNWSLGVRPTNSPSVLIANDPSKTVTIDGYTSGTYPDSMTISNLTLLGSAGTTNTLFLSNAGTFTPLIVQNSLAILGGGALLMTNSSLQVGGPAGGSFVLEGSAALSGTNSFFVGLTVGFSTNSSGFLSMANGQAGFSSGYIVVGYYGSGQVVLSNGTCQAGDNSSVTNDMFLGLASGSQGALTILGGNFVATEQVSLGEDAGSTGLVWISGGQLILTNNYLLTIGGYGVGQMVLSNGAIAASDVEVANAPGSQGTLLITGGTATFSGALAMGVGLGATGTVSISGGRLAVTNRAVIVGNYGVGQLMLPNGALLAQTAILGNSYGAQGTLAITGGNATLTNQSGTGQLVVGQQGAGSLIQNGGALTLDRLTIASGSATNFIFGHTTNVLGYAGIGQVTLSNGVVLSPTVEVAFGTNSQGSLTIAGGTLIVTNQTRSAQLMVGQFGTGSLVQNGGSVFVDRLTIGSGIFSNMLVGYTNFVVYTGVGLTTISNGELYSRQLLVGASSQGSLAIAGGTAFVSSNLVAGVSSNSLGTIQITGGNLNVANPSGTAQLVVGQLGQGAFAQSGGTLTVDQLFVTGSNSAFNFSSGAINTKSTMASNGQVFAVGDGSGAATFHLLGGVHTFADGLPIRGNSVLSGCGTINGDVVVDVGGKVLADCGGTLTFTGIVTNNGSLKAVNGTVLEFYGPVVNNGVINILDGNTNFHAGFLNNGVVISTDSVPQIVSISVVGSDLQVQFTTANSPTYVFEYTDSLENQSWNPIISVTGSGGIMSATDPGAASLPHRFYRVRLVVPQ
jgi:T5SS/PEP-CTERM-associated repeat protein